MSQFTDPIVVPVEREGKYYEGLFKINGKILSSEFCAYLIYTNNELILFIWIKYTSIKKMSENLMDSIWNKESSLHQVISSYFCLL